MDGDGIIEMGEENYYETPPTETTYFLDIFAVADQEYRDYYSRWWDDDNYKDWIHYSVDGASLYFMEEFDVKLKVVEISEDVWNSDDADDPSSIFALRKDADVEYNWGNNKKGMDTLIAFTGKDPYIEGVTNRLNKSIVVQIPEIDDPQLNPYVTTLKNVGFWPEKIPDDIVNFGVQFYWDSYLIQHEVSHIFEAHDYGPSPYREEDPISHNRLARINGVMDKTEPSDDPDGFNDDRLGNIWFSHEWNPESVQIINSNKLIKTNGPYRKQV